jgi:hypothetical protein
MNRTPPLSTFPVPRSRFPIPGTTAVPSSRFKVPSEQHAADKSAGEPAPPMLARLRPFVPLSLRPLPACKSHAKPSPRVRTHQGCSIGYEVFRGRREVIARSFEVFSGPIPARNRSKQGCFFVFRPSEGPKTPLARDKQGSTPQNTLKFRGLPPK